LKIPRGVDARTFIRALEEDGFGESRSEGSHHRYKHRDGRAVTVAYHKRSDTFVIKTLMRMLDATRWTEEDLRRLRLID
jgi:predicted RNA binding protein YcfA (HicA-like mRNA interferase family)